MKNKLTDLNDHLFAQMERLGNEDLTHDQLAIELERTKAVTSVAKEIISNARLVLDAHVRVADIPANTQLPVMLS